MPDNVDLKSTTRCYVECISNVHSAVREMIQDKAESSRKDLADAHAQYAELWSESLVGLSAVAWSDEKQEAAVPLLLDWDDLRLQLIRKNRKLINLKKRYVTGKA